MSTPPDQEQQAALYDLAMILHRQKLNSLAAVVIEAVEPIAMIASQVALFTEPFMPTKGWQRYVSALGKESSWHTLRLMLDQQEC